MINTEVDKFRVNKVLKTLLINKYVIVAKLEKEGKLTNEFWENELKIVAEIGKAINKEEKK